MKQKRYFKKDQIVYTHSFGTGIVTSIDEDSNNEYPVTVKFYNDDDSSRTFTHDGRFAISEHVTLSQTPLTEVINTPISEFKKGDIVVAIPAGEKAPQLAIYDSYTHKHNVIIFDHGFAEYDEVVPLQDFSEYWRLTTTDVLRYKL